MKVFGITGWKNSGKTTLVADLIHLFTQQGISVATVKHAHHDFDIDKPGTDSYKHRQAGASEVLISSAKRWALIHETQHQHEPTLAQLLQKLAPVDLVIVEGFKHSDHPKLQVIRADNKTDNQADNQAPLPDTARPIVAIASDKNLNPLDYHCSGPLLPLENKPQIARFIIEFCGLDKKITRL